MLRRVFALGTILAVIAMPIIATGQSVSTSSDAEIFATTTTPILPLPPTDESIATATEESVATSSEETVEASTSTPIVEEVVIAEDVATSAPEVQTDEVVETLSLADIDIAIQTVVAAQSEHYEKNGKYLQILERQRLPEYESGDFLEKFGTSTSNSISVNVYDSPKGKGFQVIYRDKNTVKAIGYGPDAESLTYTIETPVIDTDAVTIATTTATSTETILEATSTVEVASSTPDNETSTSTDAVTEPTPSGEDAEVGTTTPVIDRKIDEATDSEPDAEPDDAPDALPESEPVASEPAPEAVQADSVTSTE